MLQKGKNSYVTVVEADRYVAARYFGDEPARKHWDALNCVEDKNRLLVRACTMLDAMRFPMRKTDTRQTLSWPRGGRRDVPDGIRHAQIEIALWAASEASGDTSAETSRADLIAQGVTSYSIGNLSESLDGSKAAQGAMQSQTVALLLQPYLSGGYAMC